MADDKSTQVLVQVKIAAILGVAYLGFKAIKGLAETFGLVKSEAEEKIDTATTSAGGSTLDTQSNNPFLSFSPQYPY